MNNKDKSEKDFILTSLIFSVLLHAVLFVSFIPEAAGKRLQSKSVIKIDLSSRHEAAYLPDNSSVNTESSVLHDSPGEEKPELPEEAVRDIAASAGLPEKKATQELLKDKQSDAVMETGFSSPEQDDKPPPGTAGSDPDPLTLYAQAVREKIEAKKSYPNFAKRSGQQGTVIVKFSLTRSGVLTITPELRKSSRYPVLNKAAIKAVTDAAPFPEFFEGIKQNDLTFSIPVLFQLGI